MSIENPGAYDEARKRIRESRDRETIVIEEKRESFEKGKEKIYSKKKLDVFELRRRIETGQSLGLLKGDVRAALDRGEISIDTYQDAIGSIERSQDKRNNRPNIKPQFTVSHGDFPLAGLPWTTYFEEQKLGTNPLIDI
jgi:hypothetical protein